MTTQEIVAKLWNLCNALRDDGITYQDYVAKLTYILLLKMINKQATSTSSTGTPPARKGLGDLYGY